MLYEILKTIHVLSIIVWVGGMVFAHFFLRPAVAALEGPQRLRLMHDVLGRFFRVVLVVARQVVQAGGNFQMPWGWTVMAVLGTVMVAVFLVIRFRFFRGLHEAVVQADWAQGAAHLARIRTWVGVNLALGIVVTVVAYTGRA
jgi:uncharacterized membrane protein